MVISSEPVPSSESDGETDSFTTAFRSDAGTRSHNEDAVGSEQVTGRDGVVGTLVVVADGMGGHADGDVAATVALRAILSTYRAGQDADPAVALSRALETADRAIRSIAASDPAKRSMGATVVSAIARPDGVAVAHIGDCRAYRLHNGVLEQLTTDHSWVAELIAAGVLTEEEAEDSSHRHVVTRALGRDPIAAPTLGRVHLAPGDVLLLCSDGLWDALSEEMIASIVTNAATLSSAADQLIAAATSAGGKDNISVALVERNGDSHSADTPFGSVAGASQ